MPLVADGMPLIFVWLMLIPLDFLGWCYCQMYDEADVITTWQMLLPKLCDVADVVTTWQML